MIILCSTQEIPLQNIQRIRISNFIYSLFGIGTIEIDLTGLKKEKIELIYVQNPEQWASWLTKHRAEFNSLKGEETLKNIRLQKTFDREW